MIRDLSFDRAIAFAQELIRIPSPPGQEGEVAARVEHELKTLGFDDVWLDEVGNVIGRVAGKGTGPTVMLAAHLDVVDAGDPTEWEHPPYGGVIADGHLHGRGAMDIKGPLALLTYAAATFLENRPEGDLVVAHTVLEERGGGGMTHLLDSGRIRPDVVVLGEATAGDICIGHRGRAELVIEVRGIAGHASAPDRARNPLEALTALIPALRDFAARLPTDPVLGRSTLAPTRIDTFPKSNNVIPERVRITVDWRVLPGVTAEGAREELAAFLDERLALPGGCTLSVHCVSECQNNYTGRDMERVLFTPAFVIPDDHPVVTAAVRAVSDATGRTPAIRPWSLATDGARTCGQHGIPTIGYAPGEERCAHMNRERLELAAARTVYDAYPSLIRAVQRVASSASSV